jgi:hypothetical protein
LKHFIILFEEKEGTSPLVRLLDHFEQVAIAHQVEQSGWEPFDGHNCGPMKLERLEHCLRLVYTAQDFDDLNAVYLQTAQQPLEPMPPNSSRGFKMRFKPPSPSAFRPLFPGLDRALALLTRSSHQAKFESMMIRLFNELNIVVFLAVRQDLLRWSLSRYHGDGSGKPGHLQFRLAGGDISRSEIGKIRVDPGRLSRIIKKCERSLEGKHDLQKRLREAGIEVHALLYEEFLSNKPAFLRRLLRSLELETGDEQIAQALQAGAWFRKVHSDDISEFVINHEEITARFGGRFHDWNARDDQKANV